MNAFRVRHLENCLRLFDSHKPEEYIALDLFLKRYFDSHKKIASTDQAWISDHCNQVVRWKGLLAQINPTKTDWAHKLQTYFKNRRWKSLSSDLKVPSHVRCSVPADLFARLERTFGTNKAVDLCNIFNEKPRTFLRVNTLAESRDRVFKQLVARGVPVEKSANAPAALVLSEPHTLRDLPEFRDGLFEIQDQASQIAAMQIKVKPGQRVLDYCAGSGGKSLVVGALMEGVGHIYLHDPRIRQLRDAKLRMKRAKISNYSITEPGHPQLSQLIGKCDWVIADVPSSGSGCLRRSPDLKWIFSESKLVEFLQLQREIFKEALKYVKRGSGKIVYITGSIFPEENEEQVKLFCDVHGLVISSTPVSSLPQSMGMNGFYCATLEYKIV